MVENVKKNPQNQTKQKTKANRKPANQKNPNQTLPP